MKISRIIFTLCLLFTFSCATSAQESKCTITVDRAPELRGLKLKMKWSDVKSQFPDNPLFDQSGNEFGEKQIILYPATNGDRFKGVRQIYLDFIDNGIAGILIDYDDSAGFTTVDDFASYLSKALLLPNAWTHPTQPNHEDTRLMYCDGLKIIATESKSILANTTRLGLLDIKADGVLKQREIDAKEKKRQSFTP